MAKTTASSAVKSISTSSRSRASPTPVRKFLSASAALDRAFLDSLSDDDESSEGDEASSTSSSLTPSSSLASSCNSEASAPTSITPVRRLLSASAALDRAFLDSLCDDDESSDIFIYFPKLPIEIRFKIWNLTRSGPRNVRFIHTLPSPTVALHVHRESRAEMLPKYTVVELPPTANHSHATRIFVDLEVDHFYVGMVGKPWFAALAARNSDFFRRLTSVTISGGDCENFIDIMYELPEPYNREPKMTRAPPLFHFKNLRKLVVHLDMPEGNESWRKTWAPIIRDEMKFFYEWIVLAFELRAKKFKKIELVLIGRDKQPRHLRTGRATAKRRKATFHSSRHSSGSGSQRKK